MEHLFKQFYDKDKGGIQWPGLIGGLVGGGLIFSQLGGMSGGPLGIIGAIVAAFAGAWLVNKGTDMATNYFGKKGGGKIDAPATGKGLQLPTRAPNIEQFKKLDIRDAQPNVHVYATEQGIAVDAGKHTPTNVADGTLLSSPPTPKPDKPQEHTK